MGKDDKPAKKPAPNEHVSTRVTVAFPFSQIRTEEASDELRDLAKVVVGLAEQIAKVQPSPDTEALVEHARAVTNRLER
jgi:hypothetical protein